MSLTTTFSTSVLPTQPWVSRGGVHASGGPSKNPTWFITPNFKKNVLRTPNIFGCIGSKAVERSCTRQSQKLQREDAMQGTKQEKPNESSEIPLQVRIRGTEFPRYPYLQATYYYQGKQASLERLVRWSSLCIARICSSMANGIPKKRSSAFPSNILSRGKHGYKGGRS